MKTENIPAEIKSKSLKEAREEINQILSKLESHEIDLNSSIKDYQRLIVLNKYVDSLLRKNLKKFLHKETPKIDVKINLIETQRKSINLLISF